MKKIGSCFDYFLQKKNYNTTRGNLYKLINHKTAIKRTKVFSIITSIILLKSPEVSSVHVKNNIKSYFLNEKIGDALI